MMPQPEERATTASPFDDLTEVYEAMIDWPARLANEAPFFRRHFERAGVRRVADVACGTGRHAAMFHSWGLDVLGLDISPQMIDRARAKFGEPSGLHWKVQGFGDPIGPTGSFDAVVCVGNSLALAPDLGAVRNAVNRMFEAVRAGGLVILHVLNISKLPPGPCVWQKALRTTIQSRDVIVLKGIHRCGESGFVDLVILAVGEPSALSGTGGALLRSQSVPFLKVSPDDLSAVARDRSAQQVSFFGDHHQRPYEPNVSTDLIMVATNRSP